jgi:hypothetical protein
MAISIFFSLSLFVGTLTHRRGEEKGLWIAGEYKLGETREEVFFFDINWHFID